VFAAGRDATVVENPADGSRLAEVAAGDLGCVGRAVDAASAAFTRGAWPLMSPRDRARTLHAIGDLISRRANELAEVECLDTGKPLSQARTDAETAAAYFRFYGGVADKVMGETIPMARGQLAYTIREPYGAVAHILPWNSPLSQFSRGVAPSLACGNTAVVKASQSAPLSSLYLGRLLQEAGLPPGVCNVIAGPGATVGRALATHERVKLIAFTGSVSTGRAILSAAAENIVPCNLELGGKSPTLVFPGADLEAVVAAGIYSLTRNAGQSCFASTRIIVHRSLHDEYVDRISTAAERLSVGPGLEDPDLGPVISGGQLETILSYVRTASRSGVHIATGGERLTTGALGRGYFMAPTVLTDVRPDAPVAREEVFGPVQCVFPFDDEEEAVELANASPYGLAAGLFSPNFGQVHRVAARLEAGQVQINKFPLGGIETPFGGYKQSGIGREKGLEALRHYSQLKTVIAQYMP
jgi:acyl-CoA reductase-like NAD-dependent aldehyde dehydrogenase